MNTSKDLERGESFQLGDSGGNPAAAPTSPNPHGNSNGEWAGLIAVGSFVFGLIATPDMLCHGKKCFVSYKKKGTVVQSFWILVFGIWKNRLPKERNRHLSARDLFFWRRGVYYSNQCDFSLSLFFLFSFFINILNPACWRPAGTSNVSGGGGNSSTGNPSPEPNSRNGGGGIVGGCSLSIITSAAASSSSAAGAGGLIGSNKVQASDSAASNSTTATTLTADSRSEDQPVIVIKSPASKRGGRGAYLLLLIVLLKGQSNHLSFLLWNHDIFCNTI